MDVLGAVLDTASADSVFQPVVVLLVLTDNTPKLGLLFHQSCPAIGAGGAVSLEAFSNKRIKLVSKNAPYPA